MTIFQETSLAAYRDTLRLHLDRLPTVRSNIEATGQWVRRLENLRKKFPTMGDLSIEDGGSDKRQVRLELLAILRTAWKSSMSGAAKWLLMKGLNAALTSRR